MIDEALADRIKRTYATTAYIPVAEAFLCPTCDCLSNNGCVCPACASGELMSLGAILNREPKEAANESI